MQQVDLVRRYMLRKVKELRVFMSMLGTEGEAVGRLSGPEGVKTAARITDFVLAELGHPASTMEGKNFEERPTVKAARQAFGAKRN